MDCDHILNRVHKELGKEKSLGQGPVCRVRWRPVVGIGSPGEMTRADSFSVGNPWRSKLQ